MLAIELQRSGLRLKCTLCRTHFKTIGDVEKWLRSLDRNQTAVAAVERWGR